VTKRRFAYLFPGQGSQSPGMGRALAEAYPASREVFEAADRVLERPLSKLCFEGSAEDLALTENTQPAILTASVAALRVLESKGLRPEAAAGHSLGEYTAHVAAGSLPFADALSTVRARGRFMQDAVPVGVGAMAAILGLDPARVAEICAASAGDRVVSPANFNGPSQVVVAGHKDAVERAMQAARAAGARRVVPLPVSAPFHCSLMQPAADRLQPVLEAIEFGDPGWPVYTNVDAAPVVRGAAAREALVRQVASPVRWHESIEAMLDSGIEAFVEVGPGKVLSGLVRGIRRGLATYQAADPEGLEQVVRELAA
jgi:[acyl-carrier-protein] S-malonyltransferase